MHSIEAHQNLTIPNFGGPLAVNFRSAPEVGSREDRTGMAAVQWQFLGDSGWTDYDARACSILEAACNAGRPVVELTGLGRGTSAVSAPTPHTR